MSSTARGGSQTINLTTGTTKYGGTTPVTPGNQWQVGGLAKSFTAAAILQLEAEGKLSTYYAQT